MLFVSFGRPKFRARLITINGGRGSHSERSFLFGFHRATNSSHFATHASFFGRPICRALAAPRAGADRASSLLRQTAPTAAFDLSRPNQRKSRPLHWMGADRPAARPQSRAAPFLLVSGRAPWYPEPSGSAASFAKETKGKAAGQPAARGHDQRIRPNIRPSWARRTRGGLSCPMAAPKPSAGRMPAPLSLSLSITLSFATAQPPRALPRLARSALADRGSLRRTLRGAGTKAPPLSQIEESSPTFSC